MKASTHSFYRCCLQVVAGDVAEVGLNMGCPKAFSLQGGMGAALLRKPEIAEVRTVTNMLPGDTGAMWWLPRLPAMHLDRVQGIVACRATVQDIMKTLHRNLNIPVSCKIRLLGKLPGFAAQPHAAASWFAAKMQHAVLFDLPLRSLDCSRTFTKWT